MLAIGWYPHTPLPDAAPETRCVVPTELSHRLCSLFDAGEYCDIHFQAGAGLSAASIGAHRIVLRRNPALGVEQSPSDVQVNFPDVPPEALRRVLRAHYMEAGGEEACHPEPRAALLQVQKETNSEDWAKLEATFGDVSNWAPLKAAVKTSHFTDVTLELGVLKVRAHRCMLASPEDGHYFAAAFRWPGECVQGRSVSMPEGLSEEAMMALLRLRYGADELEAEFTLEVRHFAELLDWPNVRKRCEAHLEALLQQSKDVDGASLLAVVSHAEESSLMPPHLKAAALAAAVRQWSRVAEAAESCPSDLSSTRQAELGALNRVRHRDGHVCGSLEEYLHAAVDDLTDWERNMPLDAPQSTKKKLEGSWQHWHQILFEYGHIFGAENAERLRDRVRTRRRELLEDRKRQRGETLRLPEGKVWFEATAEWQEVPPNGICAAGLEYRLDMQTGRNFARLAM